MKKLEWLQTLNLMAKFLKEWRDRHAYGSNVRSLNEVIDEIEHYANVQAGLCELDLNKYPMVALGKDVSIEELNSIDWENVIPKETKKSN